MHQSMRSHSFGNLLVSCVEMLSIGFGMRNEYRRLNVLSLSKAHTGSHITGQLQEEFKTWDGELMVAFGSLFVVGDFISAKAQGQVKDLFLITEEFEEIPVQSRGFGILDVGYRSQDEAWAAGGSGILLRTNNGGKTWIRDKAADNIAANLYSVKFINDQTGFVLGNDGVLLRYLG
ncbi:hypothetical protein RHGRI_011834 [Rhododendron griersonianum]|uniref:Photosynthesis system II assembly factor Ycf48/Hcf136-like domain-containing protein n=1 Tax=Rhododendron griersonianum TaxID=479676 RepID=A0AAV6KNF1_9ERIC|nr:hypothetical protein RHGRI_011834 [Rhododendron griersonianum]